MKIAAIFLSLFLLSKPLLPLLEYAAFYDYIKNELCENIETPELQCNGKCHLAKQIVKAGDSENGNEKNQSFKVEISIVYFQETTHNDSVLLSKDENFKISTSYNNTYKFHYTDVVFHPPLV
ncbi:MAG: hypothetical protein ACSHXA_06530 [Polaribacter sp.]|uniref:hypothetical protein n=1 Tax=Polaribacter sp. TaxID=1920175 RepID=UPI003EF37DC0